MKIRKPFDGDYKVTFWFGEAPDWYLKLGWGPHNGVDFATPIGTQIKACDDGKVVKTGYDVEGFGRYVKVRHSWGESLYAHLSSIEVPGPAQVRSGAVLGNSGISGCATGPHLHFGVRLKGEDGKIKSEWSDPAPLFEGLEEGAESTEPEADQGRVVKCPHCGTTFKVY